MQSGASATEVTSSRRSGSTATAVSRIRSGCETVCVDHPAASPTNRLVYVPSEGVFILVGDVGSFESTFGPVSEAVRHLNLCDSWRTDVCC